jgi:hypothetical protein
MDEVIALRALCNIEILSGDVSAPLPLMAMLGMCSEELRLPLCPMEDILKQKLHVALVSYGL